MDWGGTRGPLGSARLGFGCVRVGGYKKAACLRINQGGVGWSPGTTMNRSDDNHYTRKRRLVGYFCVTKVLRLRKVQV